MRVHKAPGKLKEKSGGGLKVSRQEANRLYSDKQWKRLRRTVLDRDPLCAVCRAEGVFKAARIVDHIKPHRGDLTLFYDLSNLQPLCKLCHDRKTALETRSAPVVPVFAESSARVVLVCGAPGSGRRDKAISLMKNQDQLFDVEEVAAQIDGVERYKAKPLTRKAAYGQAVSAIRRHGCEGVGVLYVCLELPQAVARREWIQQLGEEVKIILLKTGLDTIADLAPDAHHLARAWLMSYTESSD